MAGVVDDRRVQRAVRLDVLESPARGLDEGLDRAGLVDDVVLDLLGADGHPPPAEADQVGERDMCADADAVLERERDGLPHHVRIAAVESAGDVRRRQERHQRLVVAERPATVRLAHVRVQIHPRRHRPSSRGRAAGAAGGLSSPGRCGEKGSTHFARPALAFPPRDVLKFQSDGDPAPHRDRAHPRRASTVRRARRHTIPDRRRAGQGCADLGRGRQELRRLRRRHRLPEHRSRLRRRRRGDPRAGRPLPAPVLHGRDATSPTSRSAGASPSSRRARARSSAACSSTRAPRRSRTRSRSRASPPAARPSSSSTTRSTGARC